jgi:voltage-gated potassium channel
VVWDGIWWAFVTVTTVGYGDVIPQSDVGRVIAIVVMMLGIVFFSLLTAAIAATFVKQDERPDEVRAELREISTRLERIERVLGERAT